MSTEASDSWACQACRVSSGLLVWVSFPAVQQGAPPKDTSQPPQLLMATLESHGVPEDLAPPTYFNASLGADQAHLTGTTGLSQERTQPCSAPWTESAPDSPPLPTADSHLPWEPPASMLITQTFSWKFLGFLLISLFCCFGRVGVVYCLEYFCFGSVFSFLRQGLALRFRLGLSSLPNPSWPQTHHYTCFNFLIAGVTGLNMFMVQTNCIHLTTDMHCILIILISPSSPGHESL